MPERPPDPRLPVAARPARQGRLPGGLAVQPRLGGARRECPLGWGERRGAAGGRPPPTARPSPDHGDRIPPARAAVLAPPDGADRGQALSPRAPVSMER